MKKHLLLLASIFLSGFLIVPAQTAQPAVRQISGGVLNGKAVALPKPVFPAAAQAVRASGTVNVQVTIDEEGNVISASAVSGHPLLRQAAVQAAQQATFKPTLLSGQAVKVTGVIVYNFVAATASNWFNVGMLLATLDKSPTLRYFDANAVVHMIPADWESERQQLQRLDELKKAELGTLSAEKPKERLIDEKMNKNQDGSVTTVTRTVTVTGVSPDKKTSSEDAALGQSLIASIQGRLSAESLNLWRFNLGLNFNQALNKADSRSKDERMDSVQSFRHFIENAPAEVSKEVIDELQKAASLMEKGVFIDDDKVLLTESLVKLNLLLGNR